MNRSRWIGALLIGAAIALVILRLTSSFASQRGDVPEDQTHPVTYVVAGQASSAEVTYEDVDGNTVTTTVERGWHVSFDAPVIRPLWILAVSKDGTSSVSCNIQVAGKSVKSGTARGRVLCRAEQ